MSGLTVDEIVSYWADNAGTDADFTASKYHQRRSVYPDYNGRTLYNYGGHFPLGELHGKRTSKRALFVLNGDRYTGSGGWGPSTSELQATTRDAVKGTCIPSVVIPFSALREARIDRSTIRVIESQPESYETTTHHAATLEDVPKMYRPRLARDDDASWQRPAQNEQWSRYTAEGNYAATQTEDGWTWETHRHWLGSAVFTAQYRAGWNEKTGHAIMRRAYFLSAFDENEPRPLYFLAQLPNGARPQSYAEAIECLKPQAVKDAEASGAEVLRQGDVFARPSHLTTKQLHEIAPSVRGAHVLGVNHTATESVTFKAGRETATYARGILRHAPGPWRMPEHRRVKLGDGQTWYRLYLNTVPAGRSWSMAGNVD